MGLRPDGDDDAVEIETTSLVKQAKATLDETTKHRDRMADLAKSNLSPPSEVDAAEAAYRVALHKHAAALDEARARQAALAQRRAELDFAQKQLADTALRASFDGVIQARHAGLGEFVQAGTPVVTLVQTDPLRLRLEVSERDALGVRAGQTVRLRVEGETNGVTGRLARVSPAISELNRMLLVEADIPARGGLRPGLFARGEIVLSAHDEGLAIPPAALFTFAGIEKVVVAQDGKALEKTVTTGRRGADWLEIVSGLKPGERVVLDPGSLRTGQAVTMVENGTLQTSKLAEGSGP